MNLLHLAFHNFATLPERLPVALVAILLTVIIGWITGPWANNAMPLYWGFLDRVFGTVGGKLDKRQRKPADLIMRGFFVTLLVCAVSVAFGEGLARGLPYVLFQIPQILILSVLMSSGAVWFALRRLVAALQKKDVVKGAYYTISRSTRIDFSGSDDYAITRNGMALAARAFDKGIVAPAFWFVLFGVTGALIYAGLAAMAWRFGKDGFTKGFGVIPLQLERMMGFIPTWIAGVLIALAGVFTPTGGITRGFIGLLRPSGRAPYEQGGLPVTAMASALKVVLGGPAIDLDGSSLPRAWAGPNGATAQLDASHLRRALYIIIAAHLLLALLLGLAFLVMLHAPLPRL